MPVPERAGASYVGLCVRPYSGGHVQRFSGAVGSLFEYFLANLSRTSFLPGHMDALIDVRNLLAQGYVPLLGQDKHTVYLVQSARSGVRVAFTF